MLLLWISVMNLGALITLGSTISVSRAIRWNVFFRSTFWLLKWCFKRCLFSSGIQDCRPGKHSWLWDVTSPGWTGMSWVPWARTEGNLPPTVQPLMLMGWQPPIRWRKHPFKEGCWLPAELDYSWQQPYDCFFFLTPRSTLNHESSPRISGGDIGALSGILSKGESMTWIWFWFSPSLLFEAPKVTAPTMDNGKGRKAPFFFLSVSLCLKLQCRAF